MLPQSVLEPRRGGRKHAKAAASYTIGRLRWEGGERLSCGKLASSLSVGSAASLPKL